MASGERAMNAWSESETIRIEAFSDGVIAIAITLLGFSLKVPDQPGRSLWGSLAAGWPSYVAFVTSFATISVIWVNHHRLFTHILRTDQALLLLNSLLLMTVVLVPFATAVLAGYLDRPGQERAAAMLYSGIFVAVTGAFDLLWRHAARHQLLDRALNARTLRRINLQYGFGPALYVVSLALAWVSPWASVAANLAVAAFFALPVLSWSRATELAPASVSPGGLR